MLHDAGLAHPLPAPPSPQVLGASPVGRRPMGRLESALRIALGLGWFFVTSTVFFFALIPLLPSRSARIKVGNVYGTFAGKGCAWLTGSRYRIHERQHADSRRPAIYVVNHASIIDIFLGIWLSPTGACGVAKKEIVYYPFFGQFYWLAGHLRIDRGDKERAVASLKALASLVKSKRLSIWIWPEGHRSRDGRLRPFKKGAFHLALSTGLPLVPVVIAGSHHGWESRTLRLRRTDIDVTFLPPIDTSSWQLETLDEHIQDLEQVFRAALPEEQRPLLPDAAAKQRAA